MPMLEILMTASKDVPHASASYKDLHSTGRRTGQQNFGLFSNVLGINESRSSECKDGNFFYGVLSSSFTTLLWRSRFPSTNADAGRLRRLWMACRYAIRDRAAIKIKARAIFSEARQWTNRPRSHAVVGSQRLVAHVREFCWMGRSSAPKLFDRNKRTGNVNCYKNEFSGTK